MIFNQTGMSLIEVLIALVIVAVGAIGLVKLQVDVEVKSETANQRLIALNLAESHLERFAANRIWPKDCHLASKCTAPENGYFQVHCTMEAVILDGTQVNKVQVEVCWQERNRHKQSVTLDTLFAPLP
ncbi:prepilin-type N-terminal cleavage/methylation domain-containing protein [Vibrio sp. Of14-4]|uniref:type IV pilus modification PilV family protein n=1 Tax=Vibrio sp. Of14-4 TaxID=2724878 RepID=UPI001EF17B69|nr:prepilin-type N-terminal cleavage/methylation domain-containing protein [Vibrio sp. Of14-4]MCG7489991.1 prepilin-type N-terminal cleavage/methylation domain-containing protein [Vibrio sp. Of14-4]